ncbi:MAG TPA: hypothetical protein EYH25_04025 [Thermotoga sp.]|nr:hypothetical protein [Thermotoga sp.]
MMRKRIKDYNIKFGEFPPGRNNLITDVPGVHVGHCTVIKDEPSIARTGLTVIYLTTWMYMIFLFLHHILL